MDNKIDIKKAFEGIDRTLLANTLQSYKPPEDKQQCTRNYIDQIAGGHVVVSAKRAKQIERATLGRIPAKILRPDIFG